MTLRFWNPVMRNGIVDFIKPEDCKITKPLHEMPVREFGDNRNFSGLREFGEVR